MRQSTLSRPARKRLTEAERSDMEREALDRARNSPSWSNFPQVIAEFAARGIPADQIRPKENVFTYHAWRALGRQVRKGEHGVKILTYALSTRKDKDDPDKTTTTRRPVNAVVFHVTQTDPA